MKKSLSALISICNWLLKNEKELVRRARTANIICIRPSALNLVLIAVFYIIAPVDLFPEVLIPGVVGLLDDITLGVVAIAYIFSELIYCSGVNIIQKKINLPDYDVENEICKDDDDSKSEGTAAQSQPRLRPERPAAVKATINIWNKLKSIGGPQVSEESPDDDYFE